MLFLKSDLLMIIFSACISSEKAISSVQLKRNAYISAMFQLLGLLCDVTILFQVTLQSLNQILVTSWAVFGHCLVRRKLIYKIHFRVFKLCILILVDLIFPRNLHSHFWVEPLCLFIWWGYVMAWVWVSTVPQL